MRQSKVKGGAVGIEAEGRWGAEGPERAFVDWNLLLIFSKGACRSRPSRQIAFDQIAPLTDRVEGSPERSTCTRMSFRECKQSGANHVCDSGRWSEELLVTINRNLLPK